MLNREKLNTFLENRETAKAEDLMRKAVAYAWEYYDKHYKG